MVHLNDWLRHNGILLLASAVALLCFSVSPMAWNGTSLTIVTEEASSLGILALGLLLLFHAGSFDLSVGAVFGLSLVTLAVLSPVAHGALAITAAVGVAVAACVVNGLLTAWMRSAFLVTFTSAMVWQHLAQLLANGLPLSPVDVLSNPVSLLTWAPVGGIPLSFMVLVGLAVLLHTVFKRSGRARNVLAIGLDSARARLLGIDVEAYRVTCFAIAGLTIGLAAMVYFSRIATASPHSGDTLTFEALGTIIIGNGGLHKNAPAPLRVLLAGLCISTIQVAAAGLDRGPMGAPVLIGVLVLVAMVHGRAHHGTSNRVTL